MVAVGAETIWEGEETRGIESTTSLQLHIEINHELIMGNQQNGQQNKEYGTIYRRCYLSSNGEINLIALEIAIASKINTASMSTKERVASMWL